MAADDLYAMGVDMAAIITTVATSLCLAAVFAALKSRWLYVIAPKLYLNTPLSDGQVVTLTLKNAGLLSEEDVALTFRNAFKFELLATSKSTLSVKGSTLSLPKLSRGESVEVILLVEGKGFVQEDIDAVESKATRGKIVGSKDEVTALWQHFVAWPLFLLFLSVPFVGGTWVGSEMKMSAFGFLEQKLELVGQSKQIAVYKEQVADKFPSIGSELSVALRKKKIAVSVEEIVRRDDVLTIKVKLVNQTGKVLVASGSISGSAGSRGPLGWDAGRLEDMYLAGDQATVVAFKVYLPESLPVKMTQGTYTFEVPGGGGILQVVQTISF